MSGRTFAFISALALSTTVFAGDGILGTKASPPAGPMAADTGGAGMMPFLQMMLALGVVLVLLKFVMPKMVTKLNKKIVTKDGSGIHIQESAAFAGGSLYIVQARSKVLLLSVTSTGVSCLSDLTEGPQEPELPTFAEIVNTEKSGPLQPFAVVVDPSADPWEFDEEVEKTSGPDTKAAEALERLRRLAG